RPDPTRGNRLGPRRFEGGSHLHRGLRSPQRARGRSSAARRRLRPRRPQAPLTPGVPGGAGYRADDALALDGASRPTTGASGSTSGSPIANPKIRPTVFAIASGATGVSYRPASTPAPQAMSGTCVSSSVGWPWVVPDSLP